MILQIHALTPSTGTQYLTTNEKGGAQLALQYRTNGQNTVVVEGITDNGMPLASSLVYPVK